MPPPITTPLPPSSTPPTQASDAQRDAKRHAKLAESLSSSSTRLSSKWQDNGVFVVRPRERLDSVRAKQLKRRRAASRAWKRCTPSHPIPTLADLALEAYAGALVLSSAESSHHAPDLDSGTVSALPAPLRQSLFSILQASSALSQPTLLSLLTPDLYALDLDALILTPSLLHDVAATVPNIGRLSLRSALLTSQGGGDGEDDSNAQPDAVSTPHAFVGAFPFLTSLSLAGVSSFLTRATFTSLPPTLSSLCLASTDLSAFTSLLPSLPSLSTLDLSFARFHIAFLSSLSSATPNLAAISLHHATVSSTPPLTVDLADGEDDDDGGGGVLQSIIAALTPDNLPSLTHLDVGFLSHPGDVSLSLLPPLTSLLSSLSFLSLRMTAFSFSPPHTRHEGWTAIGHAIASSPSLTHLDLGYINVNDVDGEALASSLSSSSSLLTQSSVLGHIDLSGWLLPPPQILTFLASPTHIPSLTSINLSSVPLLTPQDILDLMAGVESAWATAAAKSLPIQRGMALTLDSNTWVTQELISDVCDSSSFTLIKNPPPPTSSCVFCP